VLRKLIAGRGESRDLAATLIAMRGQGQLSSAGESVTDDTALRLSTAWACINLIARSVSTMPVDVVRYGADGSRIEVAQPSLIREPAPGQTWAQWSNALMVSQLTRGNAYAKVLDTDALGRYPTSLELIHPDHVTWKAEKYRGAGTMETPYVDGIPQTLWPLGDFWHLPAFTVPGSRVGLSPIAYAKEAIGTGIAAEKFAGRWFGADGHPSSIIYSDKELNQAQSEAIKDAFLNATQGNRRPAVMGSGLKYETIQIAPEESQFLESQRFSVEQVARFFGVAPEMIGAATQGSSLTYANREQRTLDFLAFTLNPWIVRLEEALTSLLPRPQVVKLNTNSLLRADTKTRWEVYQIASGIKTLTRNEIRAFEDLPPLDGGDEFDEPEPVVMAPEPDDDEEPRMVLNIDATTTIHEGAIRADVDARSEHHIDAPTTVADGAVRVDVPIDATTALTEDSVRVDVRGGNDEELRAVVEQTADAVRELRAEIGKPKPRIRKRVITDEIGRITAIEEEEV
jgi:HK97 family phage portal protein